MTRSEDFNKIKGIFADLSDVEISQKNGSKFLFPVYMTEKLADTEIDALELSVRSYNCLKRAGIHTIGALCERVHESGDLKSIRNCGKTSIAEIMDNLFAYHYSLLTPDRQETYLTKVIVKNERYKYGREG